MQYLSVAEILVMGAKLTFSGAWVWQKNIYTDVLQTKVRLIILQEMESKIRSTLYEIYFGKTKDIVNGLRSATPLADLKKQIQLNDEIKNALSKRPTHQ